tara:strand:- start:13801 stop:14973 length:1173 start_codon:yes stop_codon:yes gene_type:complete
LKKFILNNNFPFMKSFITLTLTLLLFNCEAPIKKTPNHAWAFPYFEKVDSINPILVPSGALKFLDPMTLNEVAWEERNVLNPTAIVRNDTVFLLYRAQDQWGTSRIGMAISTDGIHFTKKKKPIFYPKKDAQSKQEWNFRKVEGEPYDLDCVSCYFDGVEDPRIVKTEEGNYLMTYTAYNGKIARLSSASSADLIKWTKHGSVLKGEKYQNYWSKSGAIITELIGNQQVAKKIDGKYWMYFGDTQLFMASSEDLIKWEAAINQENGELISVLHPRKGFFDSRLVEPGPYALYTEKGIVLIYNASNAANFNDPSLPKFTYAAGQALFDKAAPFKQIDRTPSYFIYPDKDYEKVGEVNEVCFVEGLVFFNRKWFLYYGTGDSKIAVAIYDPL